MSENIVLLSGAPRKDGNTERLAAAFMEGAESAGKTVTKFRVADMQIGGCRGCEHCMKEKGVCVQKDDMSAILDALKQADAVVLASPVYYFNISAQTKLAIDRTFALLWIETPIKRAALLMTSGDESPDVAEAAVAMLTRICDYSKWENAGAVIAGGLHIPGEIDGRAELESARALGREI